MQAKLEKQRLQFVGLCFSRRYDRRHTTEVLFQNASASQVVEAASAVCWVFAFQEDMIGGTL